MRALESALEVGAPALSNLVVLVLAWDVIKIGLLAEFESDLFLTAACCGATGR
jgi:hypothetical protein